MSLLRAIIGVVITLMCAASVYGAGVQAVSSGAHAWVAVLEKSGETPYQLLYHVPSLPGGRLGLAYPTRVTLPANARLLAAVDARLIYALEPQGLQVPTTPALTRVREIIARRVDGPRPFVYDPPSALPHVPESLEILDSTGIAGEAWILGRLDSTEEARLFRMVNTEWASEIGFSMRDGAAPLLVDSNGEPAALRLNESGGVTLWRLERGEGRTGFSRRPIGSIEGLLDAISIGDRVVIVTEAGEAQQIGLLTGGERQRIAALGFAPSTARIVNMGGHAGAVWRTDDGKLMARVISLSGIQLFEGTLGAPPVVTAQDLQVLLLVFASFILSIVFFIWRPFESSGSVDFPPDAVLADPSRRLTAWLVDVGVPVLVASAIWGVSPLEIVFLAPELSLGVWPTLTAIVLFIAHTSIGESTTGRSLGKALARCRVIDRTGGPPSFGRALLRSFIRGMCPSLGLVLLLGPVIREPWACGTYVVMPRADDAEGAGRDGSAGDRGGDRDRSD